MTEVGPLLALLGFTLVAGCSASSGDSASAESAKPEPNDSGAGWEDADGDGYGDDVDCEPDNAEVHPDAVEICDGIDNDCDGRVDHDAVDETAWYGDGDGDGYGDPGSETWDCSGGDGQVGVGEDCDDEDADVHPSAAEICYDDIDQDCSGTVSPQDCDEDGQDAEIFGGPDCDDADPSTYVGAPETCDDDVDNDCDGQFERCAAGSEAILLGGDVGERAGSLVTGLGDLDANGVNDIAVHTSPNRGVACVSDGGCGPYLVLGPITGESQLESWSLVDDSPETLSPILMPAGDVDGDGLDDLLMVRSGSPVDNAIAYLLTSPVETGAPEASAIATFSLAASEERAEISDQAVVTDLDGNGNTDLAFGGRGDDGLSVAWLVRDLGADEVVLDLDAIELRIPSSSAGDTSFWSKVAPAGDLNGDGLEDLLVANPEDDSAGDDAGAVYVVLGPGPDEDMDLADADATWLGSPSDYAGYALSGGGDVDGDGRFDLLVGAPTYPSPGAAYLVSGTACCAGEQDLATLAQRLVGDVGVDAAGDDDDQAGASVAIVGDLDRDGFADLAIGAPHTPSTDSATGVEYTLGGALYVVLGPASGVTSLTQADLHVTGDMYDHMIGDSVSRAGDLTGDGAPDLLFGGPGLGKGEHLGAAYVMSWLD